MKDSVLSTLGHVKRLMSTHLVVKLGGAALDGSEVPPWILEDIGLLRQLGVSVLLVHGGGPSINEELKKRGITWKFIDGQRVTTPEIMEVIEVVLFGTVNRKIVRALNLTGIPAVGISGVEASTLFCKPAGGRLGQVGSVEEVDTALIQSILTTKTRDGKGAVPVIAPIGTDGGKTFNINADWAASRIAQSLGIKKMLFLTDQNGILDEKGEIASELDASELSHMIETGIVKDGMLAKAKAILEALKNGVTAIHVINGNRQHALIEELFTDRGVGTICRTRSRLAKEEE